MLIIRGYLDHIFTVDMIDLIYSADCRQQLEKKKKKSQMRTGLVYHL